MYNNYLKILLFLLFIVLFTACSQWKKKQLHGKWVATKVTLAGDSMRLDPSDIHFEFLDKTYTYKGTIGYREAGSYHLSGVYLISKDTTRADAVEKTVRILQLQGDSLRIGMLADGKEQVMQLVREER